jgi:hypothetical protein
MVLDGKGGKSAFEPGDFIQWDSNIDCFLKAKYCKSG